MADVPQLPAGELDQPIPFQICCKPWGEDLEWLKAKASVRWNNISCGHGICLIAPRYPSEE